MYLERLTLKNTGPIKNLDLDCSFSAEGSPFPIAIIGTNGSGKSTFLAHIVNGLISFQAHVFEDSDVERGKVYKLRSSTFIHHGATYSMSKVNFSNDMQVAELQLNAPKKDFLGEVNDYEYWDNIDRNETSHYYTNIHNKNAQIREELNTSVNVYFPPNRYEEPVWLNELNLKNRAKYNTDRKIQGISNRPIVQHAPLREIQNWLLDLIYDSYALERTTTYQPQEDLKQPFRAVQMREGPASSLLKEVEKILRVLFGMPAGEFEWNVGGRNQRSIGFAIGGELITENVFSLSTGQTAVLDLFLTLMRDFDLSDADFVQLLDVRGIVTIDEIDLHLHSDLQHDLLPQLMKLFPKVQFIVTTHSPLFLLGMKKTYGSDGFQLLNLPEGEEIDVERFSEFENAYQYLKDSAKFQDEIRKNLEETNRLVLHLEGDTDIEYLTVAAKLLGKSDIIQKFSLVNAGGYSYLDKIWSAYNSHLAQTIPTKWILMYDCDTRKIDAHKGNIFRRVIPQMDHHIKKGVENLFSNETIERATQQKPDFIDISYEHKKLERGEEIVVPEEWTVNKDEKRNLCDWICQNGDVDDFKNFEIVFEILEEVANT